MPVLCPQHRPAGKGPRQPCPNPASAESDEFGSFLYWRPPLPSIEEELRELLVRFCSLFPVLTLPFLAGLSRPLCAALSISSPHTAQAISGSPEPPEEHRSSAGGASAGEEEEEDEDEESDDEGWITPSNLKQAQQDTGHCDTAPVGVQVGCVTTDFAMQVGAGLKPWGCSHQSRAESLGRGEQPWDSSVCQSSRISVPEASAKSVGLSVPAARVPLCPCSCRMCCCRWVCTCWLSTGC